MLNSKKFGAVALGLLLVSGAVSYATMNTKNVTTEVTTQLVSPPSSPQASTSVVVNNTKVSKINPDPNQIIVFNTPVVYESVEFTIRELKRIQAEGFKEAYLVLDSPGGSVIDGAKLLSYIKYSDLKVHTVCDGMCASMAAHLFEGGKTRYMTDKSLLMFHPASGGLMGTLEQMLSQLTMIKLYVDRMDAEVALRANIDYNTFKNKVVNEYWLESTDAVSSNLADKIAFINYSRKAEGVFDMDNYLTTEEDLEVPDNLKRRGYIFESVKLRDLVKGK